MVEKISRHEEVFTLAKYWWHLHVMFAFGLFWSTIAMLTTYTQNSTSRYDSDIDALNDSRIGPDWVSYFSYLGEPEFLTAGVPLLMYLVSMPAGIVFSWLLATSVFYAGFLKAFFQEPRPLWWAGEALADHTKGQACSDDYGQPSGHSLMAVNWLVLPMLIFILYPQVPKVAQACCYLVAFLLVFAIAWSRAVRSIHFLYQVHCGLAIGILVFSFSLILLARLYKFANRMTVPIRLLGMSLTLLLLLPTCFSITRTPADFATWVANAENSGDCASDKMPSKNAAFWVACIGIGLMSSFSFAIKYHFDHHLERASPLHGIAMFLLTAGIAFGIVEGGGAAFKKNEAKPYVTAFLREFLPYMIASWTLTLVMPMLYLQLGWLIDKNDDGSTKTKKSVSDRPRDSEVSTSRRSETPLMPLRAGDTAV